MPQERLSNDEFFTKLTSLLATATNAHKSSVFLTQKALPPTPSDASEAPKTLLIRATDGATDSKKKVKIATEVNVEQLDRFYGKYAEVMKAGLGSLKKRDRKAKKKQLKAKKGKGGKVEEKTAA